MKPLKVCQVLGEYLIQKIVTKTIWQLQRLKFNLSGGEGFNICDDICVQVQTGESIYWNQYEEAIDGYISSGLDKLKTYEKYAIWYQTIDGELCNEDPDCEPAYNQHECFLLIKERVLNFAGDYSNKKIGNYLG